MVAFPEPKSLNILEIGDSLDHRTMTYDLNKPHPGYLKDPNIINEFGHTIYPKMVYPEGKEQPGKVVNSAEEEAEIMGCDIASLHHQGVAAREPTIEELKAKLALLEGAKEQSVGVGNDKPKQGW